MHNTTSSSSLSITSSNNCDIMSEYCDNEGAGRFMRPAKSLRYAPLVFIYGRKGDDFSSSLTDLRHLLERHRGISFSPFCDISIQCSISVISLNIRL